MSEESDDCPVCNGLGEVLEECTAFVNGVAVSKARYVECEACKGTGKA